MAVILNAVKKLIQMDILYRYNYLCKENRKLLTNGSQEPESSPPSQRLPMTVKLQQGPDQQRKTHQARPARADKRQRNTDNRQ